MGGGETLPPISMAATDYDFNATRNEIIQRAFRVIGILSLGETLSADQLDQGQRALNSIVKSWQSDHIFLWSLVTQTQATVAGTAFYSLPTSPTVINIDRAYVRDSNSTDQYLEVISYRTYQDIAVKSTRGFPVQIAVDNATTPKMYLWPTPDAIYTVYYLAILKLQDMDTAAGTPDFPTKFIEPLVYWLAWNLGDEYGLPIGERQTLERKAKEFYTLAKKGDRERSDYEFCEPAFRVRR